MNSEDEFKEKMADAVYHDLIEFKRLKRVSEGGNTYLFPYGGEVYRVSTFQNNPGERWAVMSPGSSSPIVDDCRTRKQAIREMVKKLHGTKCAAGYVIGQDSCPHCDAKTEEYEEKYK